MKVKLNWLKELVDLSNISIQEIVEKLSLHSVEVEGVSKLVEATNLIIGYVITKDRHPDSDHLSLLKVDVGSEVLEIICGAPNVAQGQYVIVALDGAVLPGGIKIKRSKIRGVYSNGMVCSLQELGIEKKYISEEYADGIYYFKEPQEIGADPLKVLDLDDVVISIDITPNRGDLLSMIGVAYECSALFNRPLKPLFYELIKVEGEKIDVRIDSKQCITYYAQIVKDVKIQKSPSWLISRLIAFGIRPINNCVDITNYILALFGQPLHAFDYHRLGKTIVVRNAYHDEEITTLDGIKRKLLESDLVITDGKVPVAIAGVMGGLETEVTNDTKDLVIEAAVFDPLSIRKTSSRLGLRSESSYRFERGVDVNRVTMALDYACFLFQTLAGAKVVNNKAFAGVDAIPDKKITITKENVSSLLGIDIEEQDIKKIIESFGFKMVGNDVYVPNRRRDINIKEDLIEEIGRLYGYDKLKITLPKDDLNGYLTPLQKKIKFIKHTLSKIGLNEAVTYSLVSKDKLQQFNFFSKAESLSLLMPLSEEREYLRFSLLPSLIDVCKYNFSRKNYNLSIFEIGNVYYRDSELKEDLYLSGLMANEFTSTLWAQKQENVDFYVVKGVLDYLFHTLGISPSYQPMNKSINELHPKRTAEIVLNDEVIGFVGQLHPQYSLQHDLDNVYAFEINLEKILNHSQPPKSYRPVSKLPSVERDLAIVVKKDVMASKIIEVIKYSEKNILEDVIIFDVYQGEHIQNDEKSIACKLIFTSQEALTDEEINSKIKKILKNLEYQLQAKLRS